MKANNLIEAIQIFDPREPLKGVELKSFYVNRPDNPRTDMMNLIQSMGLHGNHVKILGNDILRKPNIYRVCQMYKSQVNCNPCLCVCVYN